jgi:hypothetical protein
MTTGDFLIACVAHMLLLNSVSMNNESQGLAQEQVRAANPLPLQAY